jgi:Protein of unknown function (DUF3551)
MRKTILTVVALSGAAIVTTITSGPAAAYDYPWCVQGRGVGIPGDCSYQTYGQCMASASGRNVYCNINPRVAFGRAPYGRGPYGQRYYAHPYPYYDY